MSKRPRPPDDLPASNGHTGPAAAPRPAPDDRRAAPRPAPDDRRAALPALLASRWAVILKRFRDYVHRE
jgi:hypothetical protein